MVVDKAIELFPPFQFLQKVRNSQHMVPTNIAFGSRWHTRSLAQPGSQQVLLDGTRLILLNLIFVYVRTKKENIVQSLFSDPFYNIHSDHFPILANIKLSLGPMRIAAHIKIVFRVLFVLVLWVMCSETFTIISCATKVNVFIIMLYRTLGVFHGLRSKLVSGVEATVAQTASFLAHGFWAKCLICATYTTYGGATDLLLLCIFCCFCYLGPLAFLSSGPSVFFFVGARTCNGFFLSGNK